MNNKVTLGGDSCDRFRDMRVVGSGICCAVGLNAESASCALRAGMDHFRESDFISNDGSPIRIARIEGESRWGAARLAQWAKYALEECLDSVAVEERTSIPVVLMTCDLQRPMGAEQIQFETARSAQEALCLRFAQGSLIIPGGRGGFSTGLRYAQKMMLQPHVRKVIVLGLDSFLNSANITHYLSEERLLASGNSDGFIPGEAAAAVLLERADMFEDASGLHISGIGHAHEEGRFDGSVPSRSKGMSAAMREALVQANATLNDVDFRISDQNGEAFFAKDAANALTRVAESGGTLPELLTIADCVGEVGSACGPLMLAWMHRYMPHPDAPGSVGMMHLASDDGDRSAVILRQHALI
ncbi:hypothetical protein [Diaphorobacter caeni]|uniref:hypothetical protein n=1 Tax=Diaphorobacter caeni TaxID=2784387 RepID=UPI00188EA209|nr:hypothetical protein [Diaphorobacter caeni]MBF5005295.1 hypothetical protein [Diaphorobacter caeni]